MTVNSNYNAYSSYGSSGVSSSTQRAKPNFEEMAQQLLTSMDSDNSSSIDKAEFSAAAQALSSSNSSSSNGSSSASDVFDKLDTNSDGSLSTDELIAALKNMKPSKQPHGEGKDQDGSMPPPPPDGMPPPPPPSDTTSSSDSSSLDQIFSALDVNQDGSISQDELAALFSNTSNKSSTTDSSSQTDSSIKQRSNDWLQKILTSYGSNSSASTDTTSLLNLSA